MRAAQFTTSYRLEDMNDSLLLDLWDQLCHAALLKFNERMKDEKHLTPERKKIFIDEVTNELFPRLRSLSAHEIREYQHNFPYVYQLKNLLAEVYLNVPKLGGRYTSLGHLPDIVKRDIDVIQNPDNQGYFQVKINK